MRRRKKDPKAYERLKKRLAANFRSVRQRERWKLPEILQVRDLRAKGVTSVEIARRLVRSLASIQAVNRKFIHLKKLNLPITEATISEKILYEMTRKRKENLAVKKIE